MRSLAACLSIPLFALACDNQGEARAGARTEQVTKRDSAPPNAKSPAEVLAKAEKPDGAGPAPPPAEQGEDRPEEAPAIDEAAPPEPPADYGVIKPSDPAPDPSTLTVHGLAGYEVVAIHDKPDPESPRLGYLRIGTRVKVTPKVEGVGCPKGWHQLAQGGYACVNKGLVVDAKAEPFMKTPPPPARLDEPLPYDYAYVRRWNAPMWWRVPTSEEVAAAEVLRTERELQRLADEAAAKGLPPPAPKTKPADAPPSDAPADEADLKALPSVDDAPPPEMARDEKTSIAATEKAPPKETIPISRLPLKPEKSWLERGFYISVGEKIVEEGRTWWRTARGGFVDVTAAHKYAGKDFQGVPLAEGASFPFGFVMSDTTKLLELSPEGKLKVVGTLEKKAFVDVGEETEISGKTYMILEDGKLVKKADIRLADPQPLPKGIQAWERWIDVSLDKQILVAYEGERPVFTSLVSTGKKGTPEDPFETPTGRWRIRSKHVSTTMDGNTASDGNYSIQDVPWTMFFEGSFALHGAFWHQGFGRVRSHGCVNLGPSAARWLFFWTTPFLPEGWHGVHAHAGSPGTTVIVRR
ncbi:MAG TPA: L,D-transpeptidase [Nannocystaceae bacterium]|nr:L,D-transpeptidase [Nannocystaceae bacterium]